MWAGFINRLRGRLRRLIGPLPQAGQTWCFFDAGRKQWSVLVIRVHNGVVYYDAEQAFASSLPLDEFLSTYEPALPPT